MLAEKDSRIADRDARIAWLQAQLLKLRKRLYDPRADRLTAMAEIGQLLLQFGTDLKARPLELPADARRAGASNTTAGTSSAGATVDTPTPAATAIGTVAAARSKPLRSRRRAPSRRGWPAPDCSPSSSRASPPTTCRSIDSRTSSVATGSISGAPRSAPGAAMWRRSPCRSTSTWPTACAPRA